MANWGKIIDDLNKKWSAIINAPREEWTFVKETSRVTVWHKPASEWNGVIYKTEGIIDTSPEIVFKYIDPAPEGERQKWDPVVKERTVVESIDPNTVVLRSVSHSAAMGLISSRDFIDLITKGQEPDALYTRGVGIEHPKCPVTHSAVRGHNYPCGIICYRIPDQPNKTRMVTIIQTSLNGLLPKALVEGVLPGSQIDFFTHLRKALKADGHSD